MNILLTKLQAFASTQRFLDQYYSETLEDDIGSICSSIMLLNDNKPADPALEQDWLDSAEIVIPNYQENLPVTSDQAFEITREFLALYCRIGYSQQVDTLINHMTKKTNDLAFNKDIRKLWNNSVELAIKNGPLYLKFLA